MAQRPERRKRELALARHTRHPSRLTLNSDAIAEAELYGYGRETSGEQIDEARNHRAFPTRHWLEFGNTRACVHVYLLRQDRHEGVIPSDIVLAERNRPVAKQGRLLHPKPDQGVPQRLFPPSRFGSCRPLPWKLVAYTSVHPLH